MNPILAVLLLSTSVLSAHAQAAGTADPKNQLPIALRQAAAAYDKAQVTGDRAALVRLLADDYVLVNSAAKTETKAQMISDYVAPDFRLKPYVVRNEVVRRWRDGAVLAGEVTLEGSSGGKPFKADLRFADVWRLNAGRWQVAFTEVTPKPKP